MTDELPAYPKALRLSGHDVEKHRTVNHSAKIWVDGNTTTNGIESAFSLFKRGGDRELPQDFDKASASLSEEFETRFNARKADDRFKPTLRAMLGVEPMPYAELIAEK